MIVDPVAKSDYSAIYKLRHVLQQMTALADGRMLINGGTISYDPFHGSQKSSVFDPATNSFTALQNMAHGRWYPTVTTAERRAGHDLLRVRMKTRPRTTTVEIYTVGSGWSSAGQRRLGSAAVSPNAPSAQRKSFLFRAELPPSYYFNPVEPDLELNVANTKLGATRTYGSSVLLPLTPANNYDPKVLILGGGSAATATTELIDLGIVLAVMVDGVRICPSRASKWMRSCCLPGMFWLWADRPTMRMPRTASLNADLYDPGSNSFSSAGANAYPRLYHSVALLLPDATVWIAGSNPSRGNYESHMEIYRPAYLFTRDGNNNVVAATRPTISSAPSNIAWGSRFRFLLRTRPTFPKSCWCGRVRLPTRSTWTSAWWGCRSRLDRDRSQ